MGIASDIYSHDRATFRERIARLAAGAAQQDGARRDSRGVRQSGSLAHFRDTVFDAWEEMIRG